MEAAGRYRSCSASSGCRRPWSRFGPSAWRTMMRTRLGAVLALSLIASMATGVRAAPYDDAFAAYQKGDYATALKLMRPLAEKGDVNAQYNLGAMYLNSLGVQQDHKEAAKWLKLAADQGNIFAEVDLANLYQTGLGV